MQGFHPQAHGKKKPVKDYTQGGNVTGPGTGTSDDVQAEISRGSYVMPTDTTNAAKGFNPGARQVSLSNGENVLSPGQLQEIGASVMDMVKGMTHGGDGATGVEMQTERQSQEEMREGAQGGLKFGFSVGGREDERYKSLVNQIPTSGSGPVGGYPGPAAQQDSELMRNVKNTAMALGPMGGAVAPVVSGLAKAGTFMGRTAAASPLIEKALGYGAPAIGFSALASASSERSTPQAASTGVTAPVQPAVKPAPAAATNPAANPSIDQQPATAAGFNPEAAGNVNARRQANGVMEFSGQNVAGDVSYSGASGFKPSGAGVSAQNMGAADQLSAKYAAQRAQPAQPAVQQAQGFIPQDTGGYGLMDKNRLAVREAQMNAQQLKPGAGSTLRSILQQQAAQPGQQIDRERMASDNQFRGQELAMRGQENQAAQGFRAGQLANDGQRLNLEGQKFASDQEVRGFDVAQARRIEDIRKKYDAATDPAVKNQLAQQLQALAGGAKPTENKFTVVPGGQEWDATAGVMRNVPARVLNNQTGQFVDGGAQSGPPPADSKIVMDIRNDTSLSREQQIEKLRALGFN